MDSLGITAEFNFRSMTMEEFFQRVASPEFPNPTGGGAVAVSALAGIHLLIMTFNVNLAKAKDAEVIQDLGEKISLLEAIKDKVWGLMTEDIVVVDKLIKASKVQKQNHAEGTGGTSSKLLAACSTLAVMSDNIMEALTYVGAARQLTQVQAVTSDLEAGYWLLLGAAKGLAILLQSNLRGLPEGRDKQNLQALVKSTNQKVQAYERANS